MGLLLGSILNESHLVRLAGSKSFERGRKYFAEGAVVRLTCKGASISSKVQGTYGYRVKLWLEGKTLAFDCDCPMGTAGEFCKHCVAVSLAWLDRKASGEDEDESDRSTANLRSDLLNMEKERLADLLIERAEADEFFEQRLRMMASGTASKQAAVAALRKALHATIKQGSVEYSDMYAYVREIEAVVDSMKTLLGDGHGAEVRELAEYALKLTEDVLESVDDSDGLMGRVFDRLEDLHHASCKMTHADPVALAKFLFTWQMASDWDTFHDAAETYADLLGDAGLSAYQGLALEAWEKRKPQAPGQADPERFGRTFRLSNLMETYAGATGDIESLIRIKQQDLSGAFRFLEVAELYKRCGNDDAAVEWAERGAKAFPDHAGGLNSFLVAEYHAKGRHADAVEIRWKEFVGYQSLERWQQLKSSAESLGDWPVRCEKALQFMHDSLHEQGKLPPSRWSPMQVHQHSLLVEFLLGEGRIEEAWREAKDGACNRELWMKLAEERAKSHPADAVPVYVRMIEQVIQSHGPAGYFQVVEMLGKIRQWQKQLSRSEDFTTLLADLCARHKAKRKLMRLIADEHW